jgi:hypothetical protein
VSTPKHVIAPELFNYISEYTSAFKARTGKDEMADRALLTNFLENFFLQFFQNVLNTEISGVNSASKQISVKLRSELRKTKTDRLVRTLLAKFERLCDIWPTAQSRSYSSTVRDIGELRELVLPQLLVAIAAWASAVGDADLTASAKRASAEYAEVMTGSVS